MLFSVLRDIARAGLRRVRSGPEIAPCPVCADAARFLGAVDANKSCEDRQRMLLPAAGRNVRYFLCAGCGFCFAPEFRAWSDRQFKERIYNDDYVLVDPEYVTLRPGKIAGMVDEIFASVRSRVTHLDFGGGNGLTSRLLCDKGWRSSSYDHFVDGPDRLAQLSTYDLVTAFEVFEHVVDPRQLMASLSGLTHPQSLILFSTLLSDGHIARGKGLEWWYLAPRNGHVSLYSRGSLGRLSAAHGFRLLHLNEGTHVAFSELPDWSRELSIFRGV